MAQDLDELKEDVQDTIDVPVTFNTDGEPEIGFKVVGPDSHQYQDADRAWRLRNVRRSAGRGYAVNARTEEGAAETVDNTRAVQKIIVYACTVAVYGLVVNGKMPLITPALLDDIFKRRPSWFEKVYYAIESGVGFTHV